jgi:hypothetical protein
MNGKEKRIGQADCLGCVDRKIRNYDKRPSLIARGFHEGQNGCTNFIRGGEHLGEFITTVETVEVSVKISKKTARVCAAAIAYIAEINILDWYSKAFWKSASSLLAMCVKVPMPSANTESINLFKQKRFVRARYCQRDSPSSGGEGERARSRPGK